MNEGIVFLLQILGVCALVGISGARIVSPDRVGVVVTFGRAGREVGPGLYWIIPIIQRLPTEDSRNANLNPHGERVIDGDGGLWLVDIRAPVRIDPTRPEVAFFEHEDPILQYEESLLAVVVEIFARHGSSELLTSEVREELRASLLRVAQRKATELGLITGSSTDITRMIPLGALADAFQAKSAAEQRKLAAIINAQAEAEVTAIEIAAQGKQWLAKTQLDTLESMSRNGVAPIVFLGQPGGGDQAELGLLAKISDQMNRIERGGDPDEPSK